MANSPSFYLKAVNSATVYPVLSESVTVIGREHDCEVILDSKVYGGVSRRHASIRPASSGSWEICDLGSSNGTLVNGRKLQGCQPLRLGDRLVLGSQGAEFIFSEESAQEPLVQANSGISITQLIPILSTGKQLGTKGFLLPGIVTVTAVVSMFASIGNFELFRLLLGFYLALAGFGVVYFLCGKAKPWWLTPILAVPALLTCLALAVPVIEGNRLTVEQSPVLTLFFQIFREQLPGNIERAGNNFFAQLIAHFFGAGLMEELLKALPIFLFYAIGLLLPRWWRSQIGVNEPLDGILLGASSAVGFTLIETLGQYVPSIIQDVVNETGQEGAGEIIGVQLLIPRVLGSVAGHIAYSGYFGYFIGLFALKPKTWWLTLPVGYLTASVLHAFWNASPSIAGGDDLTTIYLVLTIVGVISYVFLVAAILKARVMSPTRSENFSTRLDKPK